MRIFDLFRKKQATPLVAFTVLRTERGSYPDFERRMLSGSNIVLITGKRGSGKTALGMRFLELFLRDTRRRVYAVGFEKAKLAWGMRKADDIEAVPENSVVLIDEGAITYSARDAMKSSNKLLGKLMAIARHKSLSLILIAQNSAMIDLNVLRLADTVVLKEPSLLQSQFERKAIREMYERVGKQFKELPDRKSACYVMDDDFEGMLRYELPTFWNEGISKSFRKA